MKKQHIIAYPWLSTLLLLALLLYLYLNGNRETANYYQIPTEIFNWHWQLSAITAVLLVIWLDVRRFYRRQYKFIRRNSELKIQIQELSDSKKQLQNKAHTYSSQADKLKLFISDRLLEYIEYDEKFLHFKGIAAEVRHNGIICYDKVLTALQNASLNCNGDNSTYTEALTSLSYLWDLLDLSTADNIALHINNHLCECEEYFYQAQLQQEHTDQLADSTPYSPTFFAHNALLRAIQPLMTNSDNELMSVIDSDDCFFYCETDKQFNFKFEKNCELLGNENHIVLIMENLIKNALFYNSKTKPGNPHSKKYNRVSLLLTNINNAANISIYNHGPAIADEIKDQIFQLGYTTRKAKGQHGRGLGLYFVKEIVKGYEGKINHRNVHNEVDSYSIRIELEGSGFSGAKIITDIINTTTADDHIFCVNSSQTSIPFDELLGTDELKKYITWNTDKVVKSIEITPKATGETYIFNDFPIGDTVKIQDPSNNHIPRWALEIQSKKRNCKVVFIPLDISGVEFTVTLPSAGAQFDYEEDEIHNTNDAYLNDVGDKFKSIDI